MPRIRTIKPEFWTDETIVELTPEQRLLFIGLWNFADDQGYIDYRPKQIKMRVFPGDSVDVEADLEALIAHSLIDLYEGPTGLVAHVRHWERHQRINRPTKPRFTPDDLRKHELEPRFSEDSLSTHGGLTAERKGRERKGREGYVGGEPLSTSPARAHATRPALETTSPATTFPRGFRPEHRHRAYALEHGLDIEHEVHQFREHAIANGRTAVDWHAAFNVWLGNAKPRPLTTKSRHEQNLDVVRALAERDGLAPDQPHQIGAAP